MNPSDVETILGIPLSKLEGRTELHVYCDLGDGVESLGPARSIEEALAAIRERAFGAEEPDFEPEQLTARIEDPALAPLAYALSDDCLMERTTRESDLVYLKPVLEEHPELRLLVAWEATPPNQDAAFGIFVPREKRKRRGAEPAVRRRR